MEIPRLAGIVSASTIVADGDVGLNAWPVGWVILPVITRCWLMGASVCHYAAAVTLCFFAYASSVPSKNRFGPLRGWLA